MAPSSSSNNASSSSSSASNSYTDMTSYTRASKNLPEIEAQQNDPAHSLLQQCMPLIEQRLNSMQEELTNKIDRQQAILTTTNDYISQLVTGRATLSLSINFNHDNSPLLTTSSPSPSTQHQQAQPTQPQPPSYKMSRGIKTITGLYREWFDGLPGGYPVESLERQWGIKWRKDDKEKKFFNRRRSIINTITKYAQQHDISIETAVDLAEERRSRLNKSLHYLAENNSKIFD